MKKKGYSVACSHGNELDDISFNKDKETGLVDIYMGHETLSFTVKETKEIIEKLKKAIHD